MPSLSGSLVELQCKFNKLFRGYAGIPIHQKDVDSHGLTIKCKGKYYLAEDITWCPKNSGDQSHPVAAITIRTNDVLLDLNGYTLRQKGNANFTVGIFITNGSDVSALETVSPQQPALNNITVKNGTVEKIATAGILVNKVNNFTLENLNLIGNGYSGYILCPCTARRAGGIVYVSFGPGQVTPLPFLTNHVWKNIHCDSNIGNLLTTGPSVIQGADISAIDNVIIEDSTFNNNSNTASSTELAIAFGIDLFTNTNVRVSNCQANSNSAPLGGSCFAFVGNLTNYIFENCQANDNSALQFCNGFTVSPAISAGPGTDFDPSPMNGLFINCQANGNSISGDASAFAPDISPVAIGFGVSPPSGAFSFSSGITFINCIANNQLSALENFISIVPGVVQGARGFDVEGVVDVQFNNCIASQNVAIIGNFGDAEGFHLDGFFITLTDCRSELNIGSGGIGNSEQYNVFPSVSLSYNINFINCKAIGDPTDPFGIGFRLFAVNDCVIDGCLIESNVYAGIYFDPLAPCPITANNIIKNNTILAPNPFVFGGPPGRWAIEDGSAPTGGAPSNNYLNNQAYNYPGTIPGITNYDPSVRATGGVDSSTNGFIAKWLVPGAPPGNPPTTPLVIPGITNLDITDGVCPFSADESNKKVEEIKEAMKKKNYKAIRELIPEYNKYTAVYNRNKMKKISPVLSNKPASTLK